MMATRSSAEPADEKEPCFAVTTVLQHTTLAAQAMVRQNYRVLSLSISMHVWSYLWMYMCI